MMNKKKIIITLILVLSVIFFVLFISKQEEEVSVFLSSDFFYKMPLYEPVNIIWYTEGYGRWKINKCFTSMREIEGFLDLMRHGQFSFGSEGDPQRAFVEENIKSFKGTEKLSVIFYDGEPETLEVRELEFSLEDETFKWAMGESKLLYLMLMNKEPWGGPVYTNIRRLFAREMSYGEMQRQYGTDEDIYSFDWVAHIYQKQDWFPIQIWWSNREDISELEPEGIYKIIRFHENPDVFKKIISLLANPEKSEEIQVDSKSRFVLLFYVPEKEMLIVRHINFSFENGIYHGPNGQSAELGALLEKVPTFLSDFSWHYEDFEPDGLAELLKKWND